MEPLNPFSLSSCEPHVPNIGHASSFSLNVLLKAEVKNGALSKLSQSANSCLFVFEKNRQKFCCK